MTTTQITCAAVAAVLLFWAVGAHNRLVGLRNTLVGRFVPVGEQLQLRHALLLQQLELLTPLLASAGPRLDALRAACQQAEAACLHAKVRPGAPGAITSLRLADDILTEARARLPVQAAPGSGLTELNAQISLVDSAFSFARAQFNEAVLAYNAARGQFPTRLIAGLFSFGSAALL